MAAAQKMSFLISSRASESGSMPVVGILSAV
jgi:hypothetical protein